MIFNNENEIPDFLGYRIYVTIANSNDNQNN